VKNKAFQVGDRVTWSSQANGTVSTKTGSIVEVVAPTRLAQTRDHLGRKVFGNSRHETSYVVAVPQPPTKRGKARPAKLYWPHASALRRTPGRKPAKSRTAIPAGEGHYDLV